jgi:hypothetical protein
VFWGSNQKLYNPQSLNAYSYAEDNPVTKEDPNGLASKSSNSNNSSQMQGLVQQIQTLLIQMLMLVASTAGGGGGNVTTPAVSGNTPSSGGSPGLPTSGFGGVSSFGFAAGMQYRVPTLVPGSGSSFSGQELEKSVQWAVEKNKVGHLVGDPDKEAVVDLVKKSGGPEQFFQELYSSVSEFPAPGGGPSTMAGTVNGTAVEFTGTRAVDGTFKLGTVYAIPTAGVAPAEVFQGFFIIPRDLLFYGGHGTQI